VIAVHDVGEGTSEADHHPGPLLYYRAGFGSFVI
jgi:hypothetical protein